MHRDRFVRASTTLVCACAFEACSTADIDETDHGSFFVDARVRKVLERTPDQLGPFAEVGWTMLDGSTGPLEYTIHTANVGGGAELPVGERVWVGFGGGFMGRFNDLDTSAGTLDEENGFGVYVALEAGWHATPWLEPYARLYTDGALNEFSTLEQFEAGARFHFVEHTALFVGWRYAAYTIDDIDSALNVSEVELDASGVVVGLNVSI